MRSRSVSRQMCANSSGVKDQLTPKHTLHRSTPPTRTSVTGPRRRPDDRIAALTVTGRPWKGQWEGRRKSACLKVHPAPQGDVPFAIAAQPDPVRSALTTPGSRSGYPRCGPGVYTVKVGEVLTAGCAGRRTGYAAVLEVHVMYVPKPDDPEQCWGGDSAARLPDWHELLAAFCGHVGDEPDAHPVTGWARALAELHLTRRESPLRTAEIDCRRAEIVAHIDDGSPGSRTFGGRPRNRSARRWTPWPRLRCARSRCCARRGRRRGTRRAAWSRWPPRRTNGPSWSAGRAGRRPGPNAAPRGRTVRAVAGHEVALFACCFRSRGLGRV